MWLPIPSTAACKISMVVPYTHFSPTKASRCSHSSMMVTSHMRTKGIISCTLPFCQQTQSLLKEGQKRREQNEVLGKPVRHIGLNWEELQEISLPSPPLESFQITQASQDSAAWLRSRWDGAFAGSWTFPVSRLTWGGGEVALRDSPRATGSGLCSPPQNPTARVEELVCVIPRRTSLQLGLGAGML